MLEPGSSSEPGLLFLISNYVGAFHVGKWVVDMGGDGAYWKLGCNSMDKHLIFSDLGIDLI